MELPEQLDVEQNGALLILKLRVQADLPFFEGHFPGHPVLPGVVQLRWVEELAREHGLVSGNFQRVEKLKFQRIINKNYEVTLQLQAGDNNTVSFQYDSEHGRHSSGRLVFA